MRFPGILVVVAVLGWALPAHARLGETEEELTARYGKGSVPWQERASSPLFTQMFYKNGVSITVVLIDGKSVQETYHVGGGLTDEVVATLLALNAGGHTWKEASQQQSDAKLWKRDDDAFAIAKVPYLFIVKSAAFHDEQGKLEAADSAKAPSFEGF